MVAARYSILYSAEIMLFYTLSARYRLLFITACLIREKVVTFRMVKLNLLLSIFLITK